MKKNIALAFIAAAFATCAVASDTNLTSNQTSDQNALAPENTKALKAQKFAENLDAYGLAPRVKKIKEARTEKSKKGCIIS